MLLTELSLEKWLAALLICVYAWFRYDTPQGVRADTTWGKFFLGRVAYLAIALGVFAAIAHSPRVLEPLVFKPLLRRLNPETTTPELNGAGDSSVWLVSALMLVILLSETPVLARVDRAIRAYFHRVASIPRERRHWIDRLTRAQLRDHDDARERLAARFHQSEGALRPEDASFTTDGSVRYLWTRATVLIDQLERLATDRRYSGYLRNGELAALKERYQRIQVNAVACLELQRSNPDDRAVELLGREVLEQVRRLLADLHALAAGLVLSCGRTEAQRRLCAESLGLALKISDAPAPPDIHAVLWLLVLLLAVAGTSLSNLVAWKVVMIAVMYWGAALSALLVREGRKSHFPDRKPDHVAPIGYYLLAGGVGTVFASAVSLTFRTLFAKPEDGGNDPLGHFLGGSWAWSLGAFTVAAFVALLTDDWLDARFPSLHRRLDLKGLFNPIDGVVLALAVCAVARFAIFPIAEPPTERWLVIALKIAGVGLLIGSIVPTWVRSAQRRGSARKDRALATVEQSGDRATARS